MPRDSEWVFTNREGAKINIHSQGIRFRKPLKRLGIKKTSLHTWRHTFASHLMMRSGNIRAIQKLLGHKSKRTTEMYPHLSDRPLHHVVSMLRSPKPVTVLVTVGIFDDRWIPQVVENKRMGDTGFEPVTSTV
ncbi:MAG: tyrosine-type recombinase/integrase [Candidatus Aminicenantales bacterium]